MGGRAFKKIKRGLNEALAWTKGRKVGFQEGYLAGIDSALSIAKRCKEDCDLPHDEGWLDCATQIEAEISALAKDPT